MKDKRYIEKLKGYYCFACGTENPIGLNLKFYRSGESICSDIILKRYYEGWENIAHGGIISTLLDEVMSWTVMYFKKVFIVTRNMKIKYVRPVLIGKLITVRGKITDDTKLPIIKAKSEIRDQDKRLLVQGWAEFVIVSKDKLSGVSERLKEDIENLFAQFSEPV